MGKLKRVVFIDDDSIVNFIHTNLLAKHLSETEIKTFLWAKDAYAFLCSLDTLKDTLIFLDIDMPDIDGWAFLDMLESVDMNCPVCILTSSIDESDIEKAAGHSIVQCYSTKPFTKEKLVYAISKTGFAN